MRWPARPVELCLVAHGEGFGLANQSHGILPTGQAVGALEGAYRQRVLLENHVGVAEHQPTLQVIRIALELAGEMRDHGLRRIRRGLSVP